MLLPAETGAKCLILLLNLDFGGIPVGQSAFSAVEMLVYYQLCEGSLRPQYCVGPVSFFLPSRFADVFQI